MPDALSKKPLSRLFFVAALTASLIFLIVGAIEVQEPDSISADYVMPTLTLLEDQQRTKSFEEVRSLMTTGPTITAPDGDLDQDFSDSAWWGRFTLPVLFAGKADRPLLLEFTKPGLGRVSVFIPMGDDPDHWLEKTTGELVESPDRVLVTRSSVFELPQGYDASRPVYFRLTSFVSVNTRIIVWQPWAMVNRMSVDNLAFGMVYGVLAAMALYNFILFLFLNDRVYLYYVFYEASVFLVISLVYGHLGTYTDVLGGFASLTRWFIGTSPIVMGSAFLRSFLNLKRTNKFWNNLLVFWMAWGLIAPLMALCCDILTVSRVINLSIFGSTLTFLVMLADLLRRGFHQARFLLIAWSTFIAGAMIYTMGGLVIPRSPVTIYTMAVGAALEAILLSFALAERIRVLRRVNEELSLSHRHFKELAVRDGLTGLYNRRYASEQLPREAEAVVGTSGELSLMMLDVDNFKSFNDTYGHPEGDNVLVGLANVITACIRAKDAACRYGGEEFLVVLPGTNENDAYKVAERIRKQFGQCVFSPRAGLDIHVTVSIGISSLSGPHNTADKVLRNADQALYQAKAAGKNRTIRFKN